MDKQVVHVLLHGRALCGLDGAPVSWPEGHSFVSCVDHRRLGNANCADCVSRLSELRGEARAPVKPS